MLDILDILDTASTGRHKLLEHVAEGPAMVTARAKTFDPHSDVNKLITYECLPVQEQVDAVIALFNRCAAHGRAEMSEALTECEPHEFAQLVEYFDRRDFLAFGELCDRLIRDYGGRLIAMGL